MECPHRYFCAFRECVLKSRSSSGAKLDLAQVKGLEGPKIKVMLKAISVSLGSDLNECRVYGDLKECRAKDCTDALMGYVKQARVNRWVKAQCL